ncbi:MAG: type II toxin-antitoxin system RelE/ParE family toxin [Chloroflexi bacterium]|nr:type II toxin-antitoxin system RelE/ParE family toxin [Chloroflexota bacterium]
MIKSFADADTKAVFRGQRAQRLPTQLLRPALRKLLVLDAADALVDLRIPPGNRLEKLKGDRSGRYSIRINDQWRVCFEWRGDDAYLVEITDYH